MDSLLLGMVSSSSPSGCRCEPLLRDAWQQLMLAMCGFASSQTAVNTGTGPAKREGKGREEEVFRWVMGEGKVVGA